ncbi:hypothetical protein GCM10010124_07230 [Pilimelia terevasa]|uniref:Uncharacterized protein n=1 Tax=Pilimelia terevasa TaxID=53372 RepID=A0A8J3FI42_9ACTN|nr:hypothetical protein [Pilimelia terevasa]GGK17243.1 hypothetical protein GCM10010124_07230 [Pilimelia terevasa]
MELGAMAIVDAVEEVRNNSRYYIRQIAALRLAFGAFLGAMLGIPLMGLVGIRGLPLGLVFGILFIVAIIGIIIIVTAVRRVTLLSRSVFRREGVDAPEGSVAMFRMALRDLIPGQRRRNR